QPLLKSLGYSAELQMLGEFSSRFAEYQKLDAEILPLAVENTNLKAQQLSFGPAQQAVDEFNRALTTATGAGGNKGCCPEASAARARSAVLSIQVVHSRHIAEAEDTKMTAMEAQMAASDAEARRALTELRAGLPSGAAPALVSATAALDRLKAVTGEIVALSRRNTNVRSLALSLGRKRTVAAQCEDQLSALNEALSKHDFTATR